MYNTIHLYYKVYFLINPILSIGILAVLLPLKNEGFKKLTSQVYTTLIITNTCNLIIYATLVCLLSKFQKDFFTLKDFKSKKGDTKSTFKRSNQLIELFYTYSDLVIGLNTSLVILFVYLFFSSVYYGISSSLEEERDSQNPNPRLGETREQYLERFVNMLDKKGYLDIFIKETYMKRSLIKRRYMTQRQLKQDLKWYLRQKLIVLTEISERPFTINNDHLNAILLDYMGYNPPTVIFKK